MSCTEDFATALSYVEFTVLKGLASETKHYVCDGDAVCCTCDRLFGRALHVQSDALMEAFPRLSMCADAA